MKQIKITGIILALAMLCTAAIYYRYQVNILSDELFDKDKYIETLTTEIYAMENRLEESDAKLRFITDINEISIFDLLTSFEIVIDKRIPIELIRTVISYVEEEQRGLFGEVISIVPYNIETLSNTNSPEFEGNITVVIGTTLTTWVIYT